MVEVKYISYLTPTMSDNIIEGQKGKVIYPTIRGFQG